MVKDYIVVASLSELPDGLFTANQAGRDKFANEFVTAAMIQAGVVKKAKVAFAGSILNNLNVTTHYVSPSGLNSQAAINADESVVQVLCPVSGNIVGFWVELNGVDIAPGVTLFFTIRLQGADTAAVVSFVDGQEATLRTWAGSVAVVAGQRLAVKLNATGGNPFSKSRWGFIVEES